VLQPDEKTVACQASMPLTPGACCAAAHAHGQAAEVIRQLAAVTALLSEIAAALRQRNAADLLVFSAQAGEDGS
jgi:hypothetical protein